MSLAAVSMARHMSSRMASSGSVGGDPVVEVRRQRDEALGGEPVRDVA